MYIYVQILNVLLYWAEVFFKRNTKPKWFETKVTKEETTLG